MKIGRNYTFQAAHRLPHVPEDHKCGRLHGHTYTLEVVVAGEADLRTGWILDYAELDALVEPLIRMLDHSYLNELPNLENPTSEHVAKWVFYRLDAAWRTCAAVRGLGVIKSVRVSENPRSWAEYP